MSAVRPLRTAANTAAPRWVRAILQWPAFALALRVGLASAYLIGGLDKLLDFNGAVAEQAHFGLQPAVLWAVLAIAVEIVASLLLIVNRQVWLAAGALGVLTLVAMLVANDFWHMEGQARFMAKNAFLEHLGLICALAMAARLAVLERKDVE
ncbi:DoxX family protein [Roseateles sp.]|uniref:DoxX family protein n=1 Tax=Roseateles sp. TaxID=1971397 RepID=UPI0031D9263F